MSENNNNGDPRKTQGYMLGEINTRLNEIRSLLTDIVEKQRASETQMTEVTTLLNTHEHRLKDNEVDIEKILEANIKLSKRVSKVENYFKFIFWVISGFVTLLTIIATLISIMKS